MRRTVPVDGAVAVAPVDPDAAARILGHADATPELLVGERRAGAVQRGRVREVDVVVEGGQVAERPLAAVDERVGAAQAQAAAKPTQSWSAAKCPASLSVVDLRGSGTHAERNRGCKKVSREAARMLGLWALSGRPR